MAAPAWAAPFFTKWEQSWEPYLRRLEEIGTTLTDKRGFPFSDAGSVLCAMKAAAPRLFSYEAPGSSGLNSRQRFALSEEAYQALHGNKKVEGSGKLEKRLPSSPSERDIRQATSRLSLVSEPTSNPPSPISPKASPDSAHRSILNSSQTTPISSRSSSSFQELAPTVLIIIAKDHETAAFESILKERNIQTMKEKTDASSKAFSFELGMHERILVACMHSQGPVDVTAFSLALMLPMRPLPKYLLTLGIAGGAGAKKINIGDVIFATNTFFVGRGTVKPDGRYEPDPQERRVGIAVEKRISDRVVQWKKKKPLHVRTECEQSMDASHILCSTSIREDNRVFGNSLAVAVDMESYGLALACQYAHVTFLGVCKGISDLILTQSAIAATSAGKQHQQRHTNRESAGRNASVAALDFLTYFLDAEESK